MSDNSEIHIKRSAIQLAERYKNRIAHILQSFKDPFFEVDNNWVITYWNTEAEKLLMMPAEKVVGKNVWDVYKEAIPLKFFSEYHTAVEKQVAVRFEEYFHPKDIWLEVAAFPSAEGLSVHFKDITEWKKATISLENEKQKYRELFNFSPLPQWVYDLDTLAFLDVNEAAIRHYGYSRDEFLTMTIHQVRPCEDRAVLRDILKSRVTPGIFNKSSVRHIKKNGEIIEVFVEGNSLSFDGKSARVIMVIDRTVEIMAKKELDESIERFNTVSKATSDVIWDWNVLTGEMIWSQGIRGIFGYEKTTYDEHWWRSHVHPDDLAKVLEKFNLVTQEKDSSLKVEYRFQCADGSYRTVLDRAFIRFNPEGMPTRIIGSMQDITERVKHIEAIEQQNARLKEISWIQSHLVRGPLARILGLATLINDEKIDEPDKKELVHLLKSAADELDAVLTRIVEKT